MTDMISPQELSQLVKERRYLDIDIINVFDGFAGMNIICGNLIFQEKVIVRGSNYYVQIIAMERDTYDTRYKCNVTRRCYSVECIDICKDKSYNISTITVNSFDQILEELEKYDLHRDPPFVKKAVAI